LTYLGTIEFEGISVRALQTKDYQNHFNFSPIVLRNVKKLHLSSNLKNSEAQKKILKKQKAKNNKQKKPVRLKNQTVVVAMPSILLIAVIPMAAIIMVMVFLTLLIVVAVILVAVILVVAIVALKSEVGGDIHFFKPRHSE
jgi:Flp pilus assembly protein TadB